MSESPCFIDPAFSGAHLLHGCRPSPRRLLVFSRSAHGAWYGLLYHLEEVACVLIDRSTIDTTLMFPENGTEHLKSQQPHPDRCIAR